MMAIFSDRFRCVGFSAVLLCGLASCGYDQYLPEETRAAPIAVTYGQTPALSALPVQPIPIPVTEKSSLYYKDLSYQLATVEPGDTLSKIAIRYEVPTKSVIALNKSAPPYVIRVGERVKIPSFRRHRVRGGETLYAIAQVYDAHLGELVHFNFLEAPYLLKPGTMIKIPEKGSNQVGIATRGVKIYPVTRPAPVQGTEQIVLPAPVIRTNKDLKTKPLESSAVVPKQAPKTIVKAVPVIPAIRVRPAGVLAQPAILDGSVIAHANLPPLPRNRYSIKQPPVRAGKAFYWPVKGKLLSGYGKKKNGLHNDGINIQVAPGTPVKAAENGVVSYVGNEMRSFGNLILISHADGYVTTYGHNAQVLVNKGERVRKGDIIARAGATGDVHMAQLHFEIRKEGTAVDPSYLLDRN